MIWGNAGEILYDGVRMGYGALVLMDRSYKLTGSWSPDRSWIVEFSDPVLADYFNADGLLDLTVGEQTCQLRESDDRSFICEMGEFGGLCDFHIASNHHLITAGHLRCADSGALPPSPPLTTKAPTPAPPAPRPPATMFPPIDGGSAAWALHLGLNCWDLHGAVSLPGANPLPGTFTVIGCRERCEMDLDCEAAVMRHGFDDGSSPCFLRTSLELSSCRDYADFDVWEIRRKSVETTSARPTSTMSTTTSSTTTSSSTATTSSSLNFVPVDGGVDRACRGASSSDNNPSYYVIQNGIADLEGCQKICIIDALCQGLFFFSLDVVFLCLSCSWNCQAVCLAFPHFSLNAKPIRHRVQPWKMRVMGSTWRNWSNSKCQRLPLLAIHWGSYYKPSSLELHPCGWWGGSCLQRTVGEWQSQKLLPTCGELD